MEIRNLIKRFKENKIDLSLSGNELEIHFDGDELPDELLSELRVNKQGIVKFLKEVQGVEEEAIPLVPVSEEGYVLSSAQRRLWVLAQFEESSVAYNNADFYDMEGDLDPDAMEKAFHAVMNRHEIMRTVYREDEKGEVRQFVLPIEEVGFKLIRKDMRNEENPVEKVNVLLRALQATPFDLAKGPVIRGGVYRLEEKKWVFTFVVHHIVTDAWTTMLFKNELFLMYKLFSSGQSDASLPPLRIQYKDYAAWQQEQLSGEHLKAHKDYWLKEFEGEIPVLDFPSDKPRPLFKTYNGDSFLEFFDVATSQKMRTLSKESGVSLFMGLVSALKILLYQYTGQEDITVGFPIGGRDHPDLDDQLGVYINTLALRTQFKGTDTVRDMLENVREHTIGAYEHQVYPFDELIDALPLDKDPSRSALFDIMVVLQNITADTITSSSQASQEASEEELTPSVMVAQTDAPEPDLMIDGHTGAEDKLSKFDMTFEIREAGEQLFVRLEYNTDIYELPTMKRLAKHFVQIAGMMADRPDAPIHELQLLDETEKNKILVDFNNTKRPYPSDKTIVSLFEEQVAQTPDKTALVFEGNSFTYRELNDQVNQLATYLLEKHAIQPSDKIGIMLPKSDLLMIGILGILKAGGGYVPIDLELPLSRKEYIISDTAINVLITLPQFAEAVPFYTGNIVTPMEVAEAMAGKPVSNPSVTLQPNSLAYILYTSGSTGMPKGVMLPHRAVIRLVKNVNYVDLNENRVLLSTGAVAFDATTFEYWSMLLNGGTLVMCSNEVFLDEQQLANLIKKCGINTMLFTTGLMNQLIDRDINCLDGLQTILTGGDRMSIPHMYHLRKRYPEVEIINVYGPTENCTFSSVYTLGEVTGGQISIGPPVSNSTVYIVNKHGHLAPIGMQGEICVGGDGLALGYLNKPELTAEMFVPNPFVPGEIMYRTGDLGHWLPDGNLMFMGRKDDQVKIRGYRIELGEVETALSSYPGIDSVVVTVKHGLDGDKELVAYMVSSEPISDASVLVEYMSSILPAYMVPAYYVQLDEFPLNNNGKVDRKKLPAPEGASMATSVEYVAPRNETEEKLVAIWKELLGREQIGVKDNFFAIGGHSLKATRMASLIRKEFEVTLNLAALFSKPTIENIAAEIEKIYWANNELFEIDDADNISI